MVYISYGNGIIVHLIVGVHDLIYNYLQEWNNLVSYGELSAWLTLPSVVGAASSDTLSTQCSLCNTLVNSQPFSRRACTVIVGGHGGWFSHLSHHIH